MPRVQSKQIHDLECGGTTPLCYAVTCHRVFWGLIYDGENEAGVCSFEFGLAKSICS